MSETFIKLLEDGIKYIYDPDAPQIYQYYSNENWVETNTNHMEWLFTGYNNKLKGRNYSMILQINKEIKYVSRDYKSVINYVIESREEYKNDIYKIVCIKYNFDEY